MFRNELYRKTVHILPMITLPLMSFVPKYVFGVCYAFFFLLSTIYILYSKRGLITKIIVLNRKSNFLKSSLGLTGSLAYLALTASDMSYVLGIIVLCVGDSVASLVGMNFGRHFLCYGKTLEGMIAFFGIVTISLSFILELRIAVILGLFGAFVEVFSNGWDNLFIPFSPLIRHFWGMYV